ncbi:MAG: HAD family phosphatase [bacterium]|nr:HAD family phosphatase [bacterium]
MENLSNIILPKLVASDIGGTLISGTALVPSFTAKVLNCLLKKDIPVALITGYNYHTTMEYTRNLDENVLLMPQNGTLCIKRKQLVWEYRIPVETAKELSSYLETNDLPVVIYKGKDENFKNFYAYKEPVSALDYAFQRIVALEDYENITGISTLLPDERVFNVRGYIERIVGDDFKVIYVRGGERGSWLEVVHADVRKDLALKRLCKQLDIPLSGVVYFGDNFNDIEVLRMVGLPVLVENAVPEMKKEFHTIIPPVSDEGVARYLNDLYQLGL